MKTLSVIIPVYKTAHLLGRCLDSVVSQLTDDVEVVVVDDASPDDAAVVAARYAKDGVRYIRHAVNGGAAAAHNTGVAATQGTYLLRLDSDDAFKPGAVAAILALVEKHRPDILLHAFDRVDEQGRFLSRYDLVDEGLFRTDSATALFQVAFGCMTPNAVYRRAVAPDVRQDPAYPVSEDRLYGWEFYKRAQTCFLTRQSLVDYYQYPQSLSHRVSDAGVRGLLELDARFVTELMARSDFARGAISALRRLFPGLVTWHASLVFDEGRNNAELVAAYFRAIQTILSVGGLRLAPLGYPLLVCAARWKSRTLLCVYRVLFVGFLWKVRNRIVRYAHRAKEVFRV